MAASDPFDLLTRSLDQTGSLIAGIKPNQATLPTPCPDWDVRAEVNHTVYDVQVFKTMVTGEQRGSPDADLIGDDWAGAYQRSAGALLNAWRAHGPEGTLKTGLGELPAAWVIGQHLADAAVHGWDIARATGQSTELDPEIGQTALEWARANLKPEFRGKAFGPEVEVPAEAPVYDRLAGFFGRNPSAK